MQAEDQLELEDWSCNVGSSRALMEGWKRGASSFLAGKHATNYCLAMLEMYEKSSRQPGINAHIWDVVGSEDNAKRVALETLVYVLGCTHLSTPGGVSRNKLAAVIGLRAEYVLWLNHPVWGSKIHLRGLKMASNSDLGMGIMMRRLKDKGFKKAAYYKAMTTGERVALGTLLIEVMCQSTMLLQITKERTRKGYAKTVQYTELFYEFLDKWEQAIHLFRTAHMPMLVPPKDWNGLIGGGYLRNKTKLTSVDPVRFQILFKHVDPIVYRSINYLQSTPFVIDREQLKTEKTVWEIGHEVGSMPRRQALPVPINVEFFQRDAKTAPKEYWSAMWDYKADQRRMGERTKFVHGLVACEKLREAERIYQVWHLDYRGRMYSRGGSLNYMNGDLYRSLFEFEKKGPVKGHESSLAWCLGEAYGLPACESFRLDWLTEHRRLIQAIAEDPIGQISFWSSAKEPWKLIKLARDWNNFMNNPGYLTGTVMQADQTTSGYGHVACLLRDKAMAKESNVAGKKKGDIYTKVGETALQILQLVVYETEYSDGESLKTNRCAQWWLHNKPKRDLFKKCVMPYIYGRTFLSLREDIEKYLRDEVKNFLVEDEIRIYDLAVVLARAVNEAVKEDLPTVNKLQKWLSAIGRAQIEAGKRPNWMTPNGMFVESYSSETHNEKLVLDLAGRTVHIDVPIASPGKVKASCARNLAADFVHSMEAAFLQRAVGACADRDWPIMTVHDCFGTTVDHYADMRVMLCKEWKRYYRTDWLAKMRDAVSINVGAELPEPDYVGDLSVDAIGNNPWLFC